MLRDEYGFTVGQAQAHDALAALAVIGISDAARVRTALRLICCASYAQWVAFDRAFDQFFLQPRRGSAQTNSASRRTRPGRDAAAVRGGEPVPTTPRLTEPAAESGDSATAPAPEPASDTSEPAVAQFLRAHSSPAAAPVAADEIDVNGTSEMRLAAQRFIASVRLGRSRRWKAMKNGGRIDIRRTLRAGLQTGGDALALHKLGHPLHQPRFVLLVDGSRSMSDRTAPVLAFAHALCQQSLRTAIFLFSTEVRDVTRALRSPGDAAERLANLGQAWGGGTKIGAALAAFVTRSGARLLRPDTLCLIYSDGLDAGDPAQLTRALRDIRRRSAGIIWLNPHAAVAGYAPTARGMRAALPYLTLLTAANDAPAFERLARTLQRHALHRFVRAGGTRD